YSRSAGFSTFAWSMRVGEGFSRPPSAAAAKDASSAKRSMRGPYASRSMSYAEPEPKETTACRGSSAEEKYVSEGRRWYAIGAFSAYVRATAVETSPGNHHGSPSRYPYRSAASACGAPA